jgi:hypothetical protein
MKSILDDLLSADTRGVCPPQNWTTRAAEEIAQLQSALTEAVQFAKDVSMWDFRGRSIREEWNPEEFDAMLRRLERALPPPPKSTTPPSPA